MTNALMQEACQTPLSRDPITARYRASHRLDNRQSHFSLSRNERLWNDRSWRILLKKSFWEGEQKFLEPLMRFARGDVRDHIVSSKIDHGPP